MNIIKHIRKYIKITLNEKGILEELNSLMLLFLFDTSHDNIESTTK